MPEIQVACLGQSGFRLQWRGAVVFFDPYLSDSVERAEGSALRRLRPVWRSPDQVADADLVFVSHLHMDHCDLETLVPLSKASPRCRFIGPGTVCSILRESGINSDRLIKTESSWSEPLPGIRVHGVPAAHPEITLDAQGGWTCAGFVVELGGRRLYHSGDTSLASELIEALEPLKPIDTAFLPVNERNFIRERAGIIGNMGLRDAWAFAGILGVKTLVPMHWDMFAPNAVHREEIEQFHRLSGAEFEMKLEPEEL